MKCPKCGYLGFETTDRCRHCGYDFSLAVPADPITELPLRPAAEQEAPLADLDLERLIGVPEPEAAGELLTAPPHARTEASVAVATPPPEDVPQPAHPAPGTDRSPALPLFAGGRAQLDDRVIAPPPARPPLAVRRATPEVARRRTPRVVRRETAGLELDLDPGAPAAQPGTGLAEPHVPATASLIRRVGAAIVDLVLLGSISAAVLYLTLALAGLTMADVVVIPPIPMLAFLLLLNGGYLITFTTVNGQTIGKMLTGVRVIGDDGGRVDVAGAVLRAAGVLLSIVTLGLPYLPALVSSDGRALHDRLAGTRVVRHA